MTTRTSRLSFLPALLVPLLLTLPGCELLESLTKNVENPPTVAASTLALTKRPSVNQLAAYYCPTVITDPLLRLGCTLTLGSPPPRSLLAFQFGIHLDIKNPNNTPVPALDVLLALRLFEGQQSEALGAICLSMCGTADPTCTGQAKPGACVSSQTDIRTLNDFEALAWALPWFEPEDVHQLGPALPVRNGTKAVLGPGTGLGVSALIPDGHSWFALATEAGHMSFGPAAEDEWEVFARIAEEVPFVSAETILSGPGLERLYRAANPGRPGRTAKAIGTAALAGDAVAVATVELFMRLLARFAGDIALSFKALGGVYVAGGVTAKLHACIDAELFRKTFVRHPPHTHMLEGIPTFLIRYEEPGLYGCAAYAAHAVGEY